MSDSAADARSSEGRGPDMKALAEAVIGALLRRFERQQRDPDGWESWHVLMALQALGHHKHRETIRWIGAALLTERERSRYALKIAATASGLRLETLWALFEGVRPSASQSAMLH